MKLSSSSAFAPAHLTPQTDASVTPSAEELRDFKKLTDNCRQLIRSTQALRALAHQLHDITGEDNASGRAGMLAQSLMRLRAMAPDAERLSTAFLGGVENLQENAHQPRKEHHRAAKDFMSKAQSEYGQLREHASALSLALALNLRRQPAGNLSRMAASPPLVERRMNALREAVMKVLKMEKSLHDGGAMSLQYRPPAVASGSHDRSGHLAQTLTAFLTGPSALSAISSSSPHRVRRAVQESLPLPVVPRSSAQSAVPPADPAAPFITQLRASQQEMIRLNETVPRASDMASRHLNDWFANTFPSHVGTLKADELSVRFLKNETGSQNEGKTIALSDLYWQAVAGQLNLRDVFLNMGDVEILRQTGSVTTLAPGLNSNDAKGKIEKLLVDAASSGTASMLGRALNAFWDKPGGVSQGRNVSDWLATQLQQQLGAQANMFLQDGALTSQAHEQVTAALASPDVESRAKMAEPSRPGVYSLSYTPEGWDSGMPLPGSCVITQHDSIADPGRLVLWQPGRALEEFADCAALNAHLAKNESGAGELKLVPVAGSFLTHMVGEIREMQKANVTGALAEGPAGDETCEDWLSRLDAASDVGSWLDLASVTDEREFQVNLKKLNTWLHANPDVTDPDRKAWLAAAQEWEQAVANTASLPPDPVTLATPDTIKAWTHKELTRIIAEKKYPQVDPDHVLLSVDDQPLNLNEFDDSSPISPNVLLSSIKDFFYDTRSLTDWAISNLTPGERNAPNHKEQGGLSHAQILDVVQTADVGSRFVQSLGVTGRAQQAQWMELKGKQMRAEVLAAHISGDLTHDREKTGLKQVLAVLDSPEPQGRALVNGHAVVAHQLKWGEDVLKDVVAFGVKTLGSRPSLTLYTPGAPDGKVFREVHANTVEALNNAVAQSLTATPQMTRWLISQLPLQLQEAQLGSLPPKEAAPVPGNKITTAIQSVFEPLKHRSAEDFRLKLASVEVTGNLLKAQHEAQMSSALKTADMLTVSNAERDSDAAQQARKKAILLFLEMVSMFPAGRAGGILARAMLPMMVAGAALSSIKGEGGSFNQWAGDFLRGLGNVLKDGGAEFILSRGGRLGRGIKANVPLSSLPRLLNPQVRGYVIKGFDPKGLQVTNRERGLYQQGAQGYLKLEGQYVKTAVQQGERIIYAPNNRADSRRVNWEDGRWHLQQHAGLRGGGPGQSAGDGASAGMKSTPLTVTCARQSLDARSSEALKELSPIMDNVAGMKTLTPEQKIKYVDTLRDGGDSYAAIKKVLQQNAVGSSFTSPVYKGKHEAALKAAQAVQGAAASRVAAVLPEPVLPAPVQPSTAPQTSRRRPASDTHEAAPSARRARPAAPATFQRVKIAKADLPQAYHYLTNDKYAALRGTGSGNVLPYSSSNPSGRGALTEQYKHVIYFTDIAPGEMRGNPQHVIDVFGRTRIGAPRWSCVEKAFTLNLNHVPEGAVFYKEAPHIYTIDMSGVTDINKRGIGLTLRKPESQGAGSLLSDPLA